MKLINIQTEENKDNSTIKSFRFDDCKNRDEDLPSMSSKTSVSDCLSTGSNNSLYINTGEGHGETTDNMNSQDLFFRSMTDSFSNACDDDKPSSTKYTFGKGHQPDTSGGIFDGLEANDSESSNSSVSHHESLKLDLQNHLQQEMDTSYRERVRDYLVDDLVSLSGEESASAEPNLIKSQSNDVKNAFPGDDLLGGRLDKHGSFKETNGDFEERGDRKFSEIKNGLRCYKTPTEMSHGCNHENSKFPVFGDEIDCGAVSLLQKGINFELQSNKSSGTDDKASKFELEDSVCEQKEGVEMIKPGYFEKYKDKIRRSHRGKSFIDESTTDNGLKRAIQNVSTDFEYRNYVEAEAKAYSVYIESILPKQVNLNTSIPIFPQLENGLILAYFLNTIKKKTIDLSRIVILKKDDMNYLWETTNNLNYIIRGCRKLGLNTVNIGSNDIKNKKQTLVLGLLWQMIKFDLTKDNNLFSKPELVDLKKEDEGLSDFGRISAEELSLRWINYHLEQAQEKEFFVRLNNLCSASSYSSNEDHVEDYKNTFRTGIDQKFNINQNKFHFHTKGLCRDLTDANVEIKDSASSHEDDNCEVKSSPNTKITINEGKRNLYKKFIAAPSPVNKYNKCVGKAQVLSCSFNLPDSEGHEASKSESKSTSIYSSQNSEKNDRSSSNNGIKVPKYFQSYITRTHTPEDISRSNKHGKTPIDLSSLSSQHNYCGSELMNSMNEHKIPLESSESKIPRDNAYKVPIRCRNLGSDLKDSKIYLILIKHLADQEIDVEEIISAWLERDLVKRAEMTINLARKINCESFIAPKDIVWGDLNLNFLFLQNLMNKRSGLQNSKSNIKMLNKKLETYEEDLKKCESKIKNLSIEMEHSSSEMETLEKENKHLKSVLYETTMRYERHLRDMENGFRLFVYQIENQVQEDVHLVLFNDKVKLGDVFTTKNKEDEPELTEIRMRNIQDGNYKEMNFDKKIINTSKEQIFNIFTRLTTEIKILKNERDQAIQTNEEKRVANEKIDGKILEYLEFMQKNTPKKKSRNIHSFFGCNR